MRRRNQFYPNSLELPGQPTPDSSRDTLLKLLAALISLAATVLALVTKHQLSNIVGIALVVLVFGWVFGKQLTDVLMRLPRRIADRRFIQQHEPQLLDFYDRLGRFTDGNDGRSLEGILRSATTYDSKTIYPLLNSNFIQDWEDCFDEQMRHRSRSVGQFLARCREFTHIIYQFDRNFAARAQAELTAASIDLPNNYIDQLEVFKDEFNAYLRDVDLWANTISTKIQKRWSNSPEFNRLLPTTNFERVKTFRRSSVAKSST